MTISLFALSPPVLPKEPQGRDSCIFLYKFIHNRQKNTEKNFKGPPHPARETRGQAREGSRGHHGGMAEPTIAAWKEVIIPPWVELCILG
jgi:hypothetical protein